MVASSDAHTTILIFANTEWYLYNFRRTFALAAQDAGFTIVLVSPPGPYGRKLLDLGLDWRPIKMSRGSLNPFRELGVLLRLFTLVKNLRPTVVHSFTVKCAVYGAIASKLANVPFQLGAVAGVGLSFSSQSYLARIMRPFLTTLLRVSLGGARSHIVFQNPDDAAVFERKKIGRNENRHVIRGSGVDLSRFKRQTLSSSGQRDDANTSRPLRVLMASRLLWDKGIADFVSAARIVRSKRPSIEFINAGSIDPGSPNSVTPSTLQEWRDEGLIEWKGHVDDMPELFSSVDVIALPTFYGEGLPKSLIEAGAMGLGLIATDVAGCREVVRHEETGLVVSVKDPNSLADAIIRFDSDRRFLARMQDGAQKLVEEHFDERIVIKETLALYHRFSKSLAIDN